MSLSSETKIKLSQIKDFAGWCLDKHSKYNPGDYATWKNGLHKKQSDGTWIKVAVGKDRDGHDIKVCSKIKHIPAAEFYNSDKSFLFNPIKMNEWRKNVPKELCKPILLKRSGIQRNVKNHPEIHGTDQNILYKALSKGTIVKNDRPKTRPNYYIIAKEGTHWYWATIDIDPTKQYNEIVDWRVMNYKKVRKDIRA